MEGWGKGEGGMKGAQDGCYKGWEGELVGWRGPKRVEAADRIMTAL